MKKKAEWPKFVKSGSVSVKIYKLENKGKPSYTVAFFEHGKRKLKAFVEFDEANAFAKKSAELLARGEINVLSLTNDDRLKYIRATQALRPFGRPIDLVAEEYAQAQTILGDASIIEAAREYARRNLHALPKMTVTEAVDEMMKIKREEGISDDYDKLLSHHLGKLKEAFHCSLSSLTSAMVADFIRALKVSARSKNNCRQTVGAFFKFCRQRGWIQKDHDGITMLQKFKESPGKIVIYTRDEISILLKSARREFVPALAIGAFSGLRTSEIERLDWSEVHLSSSPSFLFGYIEVTAEKAKTSNRRLVPIQENLNRWLQLHVKTSGKVLALDMSTKQITAMVEACNEILKNENPTDPLVFKWKKNALRHSFASYRYAQTGEAEKVARESGHEISVLFKNYRELVLPEDGEKWFQISPDAAENVIPLKSLKRAS